MKIQSVEVIPLVRKLDREFLGGTYKITNRNTIVTRVTLENGLVGEYFGGDEDQTQARIVALMRDYLIPLLIGQDVHDLERLWEQMFFCDVELGNRALHVLDLGNRGVLMQAIAALDNALWDAMGKLHQTPIYKLLGGYRNRVPVIAIGGYYYAVDPTHTALCDEILAYQTRGLYGVKMKVGRVALAADVERVAAVRKTLGDGFVNENTMVYLSIQVGDDK